MPRRVTAGFTAATVLAGLAAATPAPAAEVRTVAQKYNDGLDARISAARIADAARDVGYTGSADTNGRDADRVWADGLSASVIGYFGHSNAGIFQVADRRGLNNDQHMVAGVETDVLPLYANSRAWSEYLPYTDTDDVRLAIAAGCYTARNHHALGSFPKAGARAGMDSVVSFPGLVYYPADCTDCLYSGNYYWARVAKYLRGGRRLGVALSWARTDLVDREGSGQGWGRYRISGSVEHPRATRLRPAGDGQPLTSQPGGIDPYRLDELVVVETSTSREGTVETTEQGVLLRRDPAGRLVDLWAPASTEGEPRLSLAEAERVAADFVADQVDVTGWTRSAADAVEHTDGESLAAISWVLEEGVTPQRVEVEVDRRTGAVTYLSWTRPDNPAPDVPAAVSAAEATEIAAEAVGRPAEPISVRRHRWQRDTWLVTLKLEHEDDPFVHRRQVRVDARTGEALTQAGT